MLKDIYHNYITKYYKIIIIGSSIALLIVIAILINYSNHKRLETEQKQSELVSIKEEEEIQESPGNEYLYVDIKGAVTSPDVYKMSEGSRIIDVINLAGGLLDTADTSLLNLSKRVIDEMVIIIYTKDEINSFTENNNTKEEVIKYIETKCVCPDPTINGACISDEDIGDGEETPTSTKVSLNTASVDELMTLPGIGEAKAKNIIEYRASNGPFKAIEDIKNITGIGESIFDKIKDFITI